MRVIAGLGVNITELYPSERSFLKGFFHEARVWRNGHDLNGWKYNEEMVTSVEIKARDAL